MSCVACAVGLYEECLNPEPGHAPGWIVPCGRSEDGSNTEVKQRESRFLDPSELTDDTSAGRKRAVMAAPILDGMTCEWAGLKFAGGGVIPIVGCKGTRIAKVKRAEDARKLGFDEVGHVHHGPDKNVVNNALGTNLHRICTTCHNRWHALNDAFYDKQRPHPSKPYTPNRPYYAHDAMTPVTDAERELGERWWATPRSGRQAFPFEPEARKFFPASEPAATVGTANPFESDGDHS